MLTGEQLLVYYGSKQMLERQRRDRAILTHNQEEEREIFYRTNKDTFDAMDPRDIPMNEVHHDDDNE